ncbi:hypothetical protein KSW98_11640, partial [Streptococcus pneumoniae]
WGPDDWGCWTKPQGGRLEIGTDAPGVSMRLCLRLHGVPGRDVRFAIGTADPARSVEGILKPGEFKWVTMTLLPDPAGVIRLNIAGNASLDLAEVT